MIMGTFSSTNHMVYAWSAICILYISFVTYFPFRWHIYVLFIWYIFPLPLFHISFAFVTYFLCPSTKSTAKSAFDPDHFPVDQPFSFFQKNKTGVIPDTTTKTRAGPDTAKGLFSFVPSRQRGTLLKFCSIIIILNDINQFFGISH